jgi:hypothetical protein
MSEKQTTFFIVNCAGKIEYANQCCDRFELKLQVGSTVLFQQNVHWVLPVT